MRPGTDAGSQLRAPEADYPARTALLDLVEGAFRARRPARRLAPAALGWGRQGALVALAGFAGGIDVYLREPFRPSDVPDALVRWLPLLNVVGNPAIAILVSLGTWLLLIGGGKILSLGRLDARRLGTGLAFGWWAATLPVLGVIAAGLALAWKSDTIALVIAFVVTAHIVPSVAEACDLTIRQAFGVTIVGPLVLLLLFALGLVLFGFSAQLAGIRL